MKSCLFWIIGTLFGAGAGYGLSFLVSVNPFLLIFGGIIIGSSIAITFNIHQDKEAPPELNETEENSEAII